MIEDYGEWWKKRLDSIVLCIYRRIRSRDNCIIDDVRNEAMTLTYILMDDNKIHPPLLALKTIKYDLIDIFVRSRAYNKSYGNTILHVSYESLIMECIVNESVKGIDTQTDLVVESFEDDLIDSIVFKDTIEKLNKAIIECLNNQERRVVELYFKGYNQREIADRLPIGRSRVCKILNTIKIKLKEELISCHLVVEGL